MIDVNSSEGFLVELNWGLLQFGGQKIEQQHIADDRINENNTGLHKNNI